MSNKLVTVTNNKKTPFYALTGKKIGPGKSVEVELPVWKIIRLEKNYRNIKVEYGLKKFKCEICGKEYKNEKSFLKHVEKCTDQNKKNGEDENMMFINAETGEVIEDTGSEEVNSNINEEDDTTVEA